MDAQEWVKQAAQNKTLDTWGAWPYVDAKAAGVPEEQIEDAVAQFRVVRAQSHKVTVDEGRAKALKLAQELAARQAAQKAARKARRVQNQANW